VKSPSPTGGRWGGRLTRACAIDAAHGGIEPEGSTKLVEHRGVRYEIKVVIGRSQWTWIAHTPPKPREGSIEGAKRDAILAAEKAIDRWWAKRLRTMRLQAGTSMLP
jgi:hypothetical protein